MKDKLVEAMRAVAITAMFLALMTIVSFVVIFSTVVLIVALFA